MVRINGVLPDVSGPAANTSVSGFYKGFNLLADAGNSVKTAPDVIPITSIKSITQATCRGCCSGREGRKLIALQDAPSESCEYKPHLL